MREYPMALEEFEKNLILKKHAGIIVIV